jgi:hypothetical protein
MPRLIFHAGPWDGDKFDCQLAPDQIELRDVIGPDPEHGLYVRREPGRSFKNQPPDSKERFDFNYDYK